MKSGSLGRVLLVGALTVVIGCPDSDSNELTLLGAVQSNGTGLSGYDVTVYASYPDVADGWRTLSSSTTSADGSFEVDFELPSNAPDSEPVLFAFAERETAMLAGVIAPGPGSSRVLTINERTTVATAAAFAQFVDGREIVGNEYGMANAVNMVANMANPMDGALGEVLDNLPNAGDTSTRATFNSLSNMVAACVDDGAACATLLDHATPVGGSAPTNVLEALSNTTRLAGAVDIEGLFGLSTERAIYQPALVEAPTSWLLFIKFTGGFYSEYAATNLMSGPGNVAFDEQGFAWINDNFVPTAEMQVGCAGLRLMKFYPWGESFEGSPYFGGGLSGAGFGISVDGEGGIWVGNFGFEAPVCDGSIPPDPANKIPATHDSVSLFNPEGEPVSGSDGFTDGDIWWPQATVPDGAGNIWVANCGNDTVTRIPIDDPTQAQNIALPGGQGAEGNYFVELPDTPRIKPFAVAIDPQGRVWVTGNEAGWTGVAGDPAGRVYRISRDGTVEVMPHVNMPGGDSLLSWPMGISGDSEGNMWVSNSDSVNVPCVTPLSPQDGAGASVVLYPADDAVPVQYTGGGITIPWGNSVDGNDTLWVFNFGRPPTKDIDANTTWPDTGVAHLCGANASKCPPGLSTGDAISPDSGYTSDALDRITGGGVDRSGNLWLVNNFKKEGPYPPVYNTSPGGNSFVIVPGAAAPIQTPLIGPPRAF